jgi:Transposase
MKAAYITWGDLMVWTQPGDELGGEVRVNGSEDERAGLRSTSFKCMERTRVGRPFSRRDSDANSDRFFGSVAPCVVAMEATRGAHYWARVIGTFGHEVSLIAPQFVKPYVRGQKNDMQGAAAICEAASRPEMRFVPQKSIRQQDMQILHRIRSRLVGKPHPVEQSDAGNVSIVR